MRNLFKSLSVVLAFLVPVTGMAAGIQVIINGQTVVFTDVQSAMWFAPYVREAAEAGIVNGYKDSRGNLTGKYGPSNSITIAEALKIAVEGAGYDAALYGSRIDSGISSTHWASPYFSVAKSEDFDFLSLKARIDRPATRAEVASIFASAFRVDMSTATQVDARYDDVGTNTQFATSIEALSRDDVVSGDTDAQGQVVGTFRPMSQINRAEVAKMVIAARAKYGEPGKDRTPDEETDSDTVSYTNDGFTPAVLRIKAGTTVTFTNNSGEDLWVASNPHPTHTDLSGFDSNKALSQGQSYSFTFTRLGTWGYHNHLHPSVGASIIVE